MIRTVTNPVLAQSFATRSSAPVRQAPPQSSTQSAPPAIDFESLLGSAMSPAASAALMASPFQRHLSPTASFMNSRFPVSATTSRTPVDSPETPGKAAKTLGTPAAVARATIGPSTTTVTGRKPGDLADTLPAVQGTTTDPPATTQTYVNPFQSWVTSASTAAGSATVGPGIPITQTQPSILDGGTVAGGGAVTAPGGLDSLKQQEAAADPGVLKLAVLIQSGGMANRQYIHGLNYQNAYGNGAYSSVVPYTEAIDDTTAKLIADTLGGTVVKGPPVNPQGAGALGKIPDVNYIQYQGHLYNAAELAGTTGSGLGSIITHLQAVFSGVDTGGGNMAYNTAEIGPMGKIYTPTVTAGESDGW
jgi:hypothetical protein